MLIAQLTDPHLQADRDAVVRGAPVYTQLEKVVTELVSTRPDWVICTGDIADDLSSEAYGHFLSLMEALPCPWACIPGNHDSRSAMRERLPVISGRGDAPVQFALMADRILLLGIDTMAAGCVEGELDWQRADWIRAAVASHKAEGVLAFTHHPPGPTGSAWMDEIRLRNPELLATALAGARLLALFCGHTHFEHQGEFLGRPWYATPATSFQFSRERPVVQSLVPAWREIRIEKGCVRTVVHRCD